MNYLWIPWTIVVIQAGHSSSSPSKPWGVPGNTDYRYEFRTDPTVVFFASTTLELLLEIAKRIKFLIQGFVWITQSWFQVPTLLQARMSQQGKQMRVGTRKDFTYHSAILVSLANGNMYEVDSNTFFFLSGKALYPFRHFPVWNLTFFLKSILFSYL